jgi:hypothetical protein
VFGLENTDQKFELLVKILENKGVINKFEVDWINSVNMFNSKIIFPRLDNQETKKDFFQLMSTHTYKQFEDHCRTIATLDEAEKQKREIEE